MKKSLMLLCLTLILLLCGCEAFAEEAAGTPITLTIGDTVLDAYLNGTSCAQALLEQLPVTVHLDNSGHDYCGGVHTVLPYDEADVQYGWRDGDLAYWTAGDDFVIFHDDEEISSGTGNLVILGSVTSDIEQVRALPDSFDVTIARKDEGAVKPLKMRITVGDQVLTATLIDNATTRALMEKMPMTLSMMDLYGREMCYRFSEDLPAEEAGYDSFDVGDISYWTPWHSFVIVYAESGESIDNLQRVGTVDEGVECFAATGDTAVTFEMMEE
ncbi:MAG: cyclophilin-like fold protein [Clostridia bacterium]|nr:cyclophilin-like fold protein [Clostridia bacterium]